jgi:hypothetical protein
MPLTAAAAVTIASQLTARRRIILQRKPDAQISRARPKLFDEIAE